MRCGYLGKPRRLYHGFPVVQMRRRESGTVPVCAVTCRECGGSIIRTHSAIQTAIQRGTGFICSVCRPQNGRFER